MKFFHHLHVLVSLALLIEHLPTYSTRMTIRVFVFAIHVCLQVALGIKYRGGAVRTNVFPLVAVGCLEKNPNPHELRLYCVGF